MLGVTIKDDQYIVTHNGEETIYELDPQARIWWADIFPHPKGWVGTAISARFERIYIFRSWSPEIINRILPFKWQDCWGTDHEDIPSVELVGGNLVAHVYDYGDFDYVVD